MKCDVVADPSSGAVQIGKYHSEHGGIEKLKAVSVKKPKAESGEHHGSLLAEGNEPVNQIFAKHQFFHNRSDQHGCEEDDTDVHPCDQVIQRIFLYRSAQGAGDCHEILPDQISDVSHSETENQKYGKVACRNCLFVGFFPRGNPVHHPCKDGKCDSVHGKLREQHGDIAAKQK